MDNALSFCDVEGVILRDSHGVAQVRFVSGNKILRIMKAMGLAPDLPEDLYYLIKKAVAIRKHLERNRYYERVNWNCRVQLLHDPDNLTAIWKPIV
jgi:ribosomal protein S15P/S13E